MGPCREVTRGDLHGLGPQLEPQKTTLSGVFFFFIFFFQFSFQRASSIFQQVAVNRGLNTELESVQCYLFYFFFTHAEMLYQRRPGCKKKKPHVKMLRLWVL